jgi:hypothetical protein
MRSINLIALFCFVNFFFFSKINAQEKKELLITYDSIIGKENLLITNGLFHNNNFKVVDNQNIYFSSEKYTIGNIKYNDQLYFDLYLKYDTFNDDLIFRPKGDSEKNGIILPKDKIISFEIYDKTFRNIENLEIENSFPTGYFEEKFSSSDFKLLIKHKKTKKDVLIKNTLQNIFYPFEEYYILKNKKLERIKSKNKIIKLFPEKKDYINSYYKDFSNLKKTDKSLFYKKLFERF